MDFKSKSRKVLEKIEEYENLKKDLEFKKEKKINTKKNKKIGFKKIKYKKKNYKKN